jgi:ribosomal protein L44E
MSDCPHTTPDFNTTIQAAEHKAQRESERYERSRCAESETGKHIPHVAQQEADRIFLHLTIECSVCGRTMQKNLPLYKLDWLP